jgi:hypothetical protein
MRTVIMDNNYENKNVVDAAVAFAREIHLASWNRKKKIQESMTRPQVDLLEKLIEEIKESGL